MEESQLEVMEIAASNEVETCCREIRRLWDFITTLKRIEAQPMFNHEKLDVFQKWIKDFEVYQ